MLTGEAMPVQKTPDVITKKDCAIVDKLNILFSGTLVANGSAIGVVYAIGMATEMG